MYIQTSPYLSFGLVPSGMSVDNSRNPTLLRYSRSAEMQRNATAPVAQQEVNVRSPRSNLYDNHERSLYGLYDKDSPYEPRKWLTWLGQNS